jgi:hypothetical protein
VTRWCTGSLLALIVACGSRSDVTRFTSAESDDASGSAGQPGRVDGRAGTAGDRGVATGSSGAGAGAAGTGRDAPTPDVGPVAPDREVIPEVDWNEPPRCNTRPPSLDQTLNAALDDLARVPVGERAFMRYVSSGYRRTVDCDGGELGRREARVDLGLLVNLTSASATLALPTPVDAAPDSLLRIDIRNYGWQRELRVDGDQHRDGWEAIASLSALAVELSGPESDALRAETGTRFPLLSYLDLLSQTIRGELYYELLGLPDTLAALAERLDVPLDEPAKNTWMRAGTTRSRVAREPRGVARYSGPNAEAPMLWLVLDFSPATTLPGVLLAPLALDADSTAALFTLQNGLFGFFTADAGGRRLVESPLMTDTNQSDFVARNALSCLGCHTHGPLGVVDEVRDFAAATLGAQPDEAEFRALEALYPPPSVLARQVDEDNARLDRALAAVGATLADLAAIMTELQTHERGLSLARAAGELFVGEADLRASLPSLPPAFAAAAFSGGLDRGAFEAAYSDALCVLHRASANRPTACR